METSYSEPLCILNKNKFVGIQNESVFVFKSNKESLLGSVFNDLYDSKELNVVFALSNDKILYYNLMDHVSFEINVEGNLKSVKCNDKYIAVLYERNSEYIIDIYLISKIQIIKRIHQKKIVNIKLNEKLLYINQPFFIGKYLIINLKNNKHTEYIESERYYVGHYTNKIVTYDIIDSVTYIYLDEIKYSFEGYLKEHYLYGNNLFFILNTIDGKYEVYKICFSYKNIVKILSHDKSINNIKVSNGYLIYLVNDIVYLEYCWNVIEIDDKKIKLSKNIKNKNVFCHVESHLSKNTKCYYDVYIDSSVEKVSNLPIVIYLHGGPHQNTSREIDNFKEYIIKSKHLFVAVNYHGSTGFGVNYEQSIYGRWGELEILDIIDVIKEIKRISNGPVKILGLSYGATLALLAIFKYKLEISKCLSISGPINLTEFYNNLSPFHKNIFKRRALMKNYMTYDLKNMSPVNYLKETKTELSILFGELDHKIGLASMNTLLTNKLNSIEVYKVKGASHGILSILTNLKDLSAFENFLN